VLESIAAKTEAGPCVTHVGPDGSGHFVKMVHNGIEYGDMQLIAESWDVLRRGLGLSAPETADVFAKWNEGPLASFLTELTARVCRTIDAVTKQPLVDVVLDKAGQKGTGKWTAQVALDLAVAIPTIAAAIDARVLSSLKDERTAASKVLNGPTPAVPVHGERARLIDDLHDALYAARICAYAQGMALIRAGSDKYQWHINLAEIGRIWKGGCIIRARLLEMVGEGRVHPLQGSRSCVSLFEQLGGCPMEHSLAIAGKAFVSDLSELVVYEANRAHRGRFEYLTGEKCSQTLFEARLVGSGADGQCKRR